MSEGRVASRYAKSVLQLAEEMGIIEEVKDDMRSFIDLCKENRDFSLMLKSPIIPHLKKTDILRKIFDGKVTKLTMQSFDLVTRKNRANVLESIAKEIIHLYNVKKGLTEVTVTTAFKLDTDFRKSFEDLAKRVSGKEPILTEQVNPEILGGYLLRFGDQQIDDTIKGQLKVLKLKFSNK